MALFGSKKNKEVKDAAVVAKAAKAPAKAKKAAQTDVVVTAPATVGHVLHRGQHHDIIIRPRITEKSGMAAEAAGVYTFEVLANSNKPMIAKYIKNLYKVTPRKINIINLPAKRVIVRGKRGTKSAVKKAMVYLKKGDKIEFA
jgi:large subunit ribosomal protein L23